MRFPYIFRDIRLQSVVSILALKSYGQEFAPATASYGLAGPPGMAGEQSRRTSTYTVATTRSAIVRYRTVPGEVYEASKGQVKRRISNESYISEKRN